MKVEFYRHSLGQAEKEAVARVLDSLFLTTGEETYAFERELAAYLDVPHVVALASCTAAEHLALLALGIGPGDEVITTAMTFIASTTAILHAGATPVWVDCERETGNLDAAAIEAAITPRTRAIVAVHLYGVMCDMKALRAIADRHGLALIEDAAHCVEGRRDGVGPGQLGDACCFSFYATKSLTCGEGGAVATRDPALAERVRRLSLHGMSRNAADRYKGRYEHWDMVELGWKYNLSNLQASVLRPQVPRLDERRDRREAIAARYDRLVDARPQLDRPRVPAGARSARHLYTIWTEPGRRDAILAYLGANGVGSAVNYRAIHQLTWLREHVALRSPLPVAESIGARTISLPFYERLRDDEVERVCDVLDQAIVKA
jgi:dTDP-4-amino-4,6-dideoxygalactose transaminase